jgi:hypothetical protein
MIREVDPRISSGPPAIRAACKAGHMTAPNGCHPLLFSLAPPGPSTHDAVFRSLQGRRGARADDFDLRAMVR